MSSTCTISLCDVFHATCRRGAHSAPRFISIAVGAPAQCSQMRRRSRAAMATRGYSEDSSMSSRKLVVRRSGVHGKGVFAAQPLRAGERLLEYKGQRISWKEAVRRHPHNPDEPNHTFYFALEDGRVIDGNVNGNSARWINHSCAPNCEA